MKHRKEKYFILISMLLFLSAGSTVFASGYDKKLKMRQKEEYMTDHSKLRSMVRSVDASGKEQYQDYYGGMYLNGEGQTVVLLCSPDASIKGTLQGAVGSELLFEEVEHSYQSLTDEVDEMSGLLSGWSEKYRAGLLEEGSQEKLLFENIIGMCTDVMKNRNVVWMRDVSPRMQELFRQYFHGDMVEFEQASGVVTQQGQEGMQEGEKSPQKIRVKRRSRTYQAAALEKGAKSFRLNVSTKGETPATFEKVSGSSRLSIGKKSGRITVKKGTAKGTYRMKVQIKTRETEIYQGESITKTITISVE